MRPLKEIPTWMSFLLSLEILVSMLVSIKTPMTVLFCGSDRFRKYYRYKVRNKIGFNEILMVVFSIIFRITKSFYILLLA